MRWIDLLRMSSSNLKRRKLRTFLTVLGVMIGTTSIVVMISLGLGLQQSIYNEIEQYGGLDTISVTGVSSGESMMYYGENDEESEKRLNDQAITDLGKLEHVTGVTPQYEISVLLLKGKYEGWAQLIGMPREGLENLGLKLAEGGRLPSEGGSKLELVYGNSVITNFYESGTGMGYYDSGGLPDIDMAKDTIFVILDQEGYYQSNQEPVFGAEGGQGAENMAVNQPVQKHAVRASGVVEGDPDTYTAGCYNVYCDLDTLKQVLKKEFKGRTIPGQPVNANGKPYKDFCYSSAQVKVEDPDLINDVVAEIRSMGYNTHTNAESMEMAKKEMAIIQAALGGIGAISLLVAAIGIANTMMMAIYERTKEIGIIKVLGCSLKNIRQMFLLEAAFIGFIGGAAGMVLSFILSGIINILTEHGAAMGIDGNISYIPFWLVLTAMAFAVLIGTAAGYFPALRAMKLSPLAAIKTE